MSSRASVFIIVFLELLLVSAWTASASAVLYSTPLQPGNSALYQVSGSYSENVVTTEMTVLTVNGLNITAAFKDKYSDLSESVSAFWIDLASGNRNSSNLIFAIGAALSLGDPVPDGPNPSITIQTEQTRDCGGFQRLTNYATFQVEIPIGTRTVEGYWDRSTGTMCVFSFQDPGGQLNLSMVSTNVWSTSTPSGTDESSSNPVPWVLLSIAAVPILLLIFFRARKRARKPRRA